MRKQLARKADGMGQRRTTDQRIAAAREQLRQLEAQKRSEDRTARTHALIVLGSLVEAAGGGDWAALDFGAVDRAIHAAAPAIMAARTHDGRGTDEAASAVREFERWKRDMGRARAADPATEGVRP